jgi:uncharacterized protein (TIGR02996 family)
MRGKPDFLRLGRRDISEESLRSAVAIDHFGPWMERDIGGDRPMSDQEMFLRAIESNPTDDLAWIAYADWLEERGDSLYQTLRETLEAGTWIGCREELFRKLSPQSRRLLACDCVERVLPLFEARYPADARPRQLIETLRRYATGKRVATAIAAIVGAREVAALDAQREPERYLAALRAAQMAELAAENPSLACLNAAFTQAIGRFGPDVLYAPFRDFLPAWRRAVDDECRWQVSRLLRYHFESL